MGGALLVVGVEVAALVAGEVVEGVVGEDLPDPPNTRKLPTASSVTAFGGRRAPRGLWTPCGTETDTLAGLGLTSITLGRLHPVSILRGAFRPWWQK